MLLVLFNPLIGSYQVLPLRARVDLGAMAMKGYSTFPQGSSIAGTSPSDCLVSYPGQSLGGILPLCRGAVGVFYSPPPQPTGQYSVLEDLHTVKWLQALLFNTNHSSQNIYSFVCTQWNGSKYCYVSLIIQLNTRHLFTHS